MFKRRARAVSFYARRGVYAAVLSGAKNVEYKADTIFWRSRLRGKNPPVTAVFICGRKVLRRRIQKISYERTPSGLQEIKTPMCFALHLES
jgi:hypothetical protein